MGQGQSIRHHDLPTLDELGGALRPPVRREDELTVLLSWMATGIQHEYHALDESLDKHAHEHKRTVMEQTMAGPSKIDREGDKGMISMGFGEYHTQHPSGKKVAPSWRDYKRPASSSPKDSIIRGRPMTSPPKQRVSLTGFAPAPPRTSVAGGRKARISQSGGVKGTDLASILARLPPSRTLEELLEEERGMHWRHRVKRAKMRLYWYLRIYVKWMAILKKKRKGYAEPFAVESLSLILGLKLHNDIHPFTELLASSLEIADSRDKSDVITLKTGMVWADKAQKQDEALLVESPRPQTATALKPTILDQPFHSPISPSSPLTPTRPSRSSFSGQTIGKRSTFTQALASEGRTSISGNASPPIVSPQPPPSLPVAPLAPLATAAFARRPRTSLPSLGSVTTARAGRLELPSSSSPTSDVASVSPGAISSPVWPHADGFVSESERVRPSTSNPHGAHISTLKGLSSRTNPSSLLHTAFSKDGKEMTALRIISETLSVTKENKESKLQLLEVKSVNCRVLGNRANAAWIHASIPDASLVGRERASPTHRAALGLTPSPKDRIDQGVRASWAAPHVLDFHQLSAAGVDMKMYHGVLPDLLNKGKIAVQLTYLGEKQSIELEEEKLDESNGVPAVDLDLWAAIAHLFPHRLPSGMRLNGLTLLDRQIIQTLVNVEKISNSTSLSSLYVLLSVDSSFVPLVSAQVIARKHWGLSPDHILILPISRFPAVVWSEQSKSLRVSYAALKHPFRHAGSGYSLLAAGWPGEAFWMDPASKARTYLNTSVLGALSKAKVEFLYSSRLTDYAHLNLSSPTLDPAFLAPAIYAMDAQGASVAAEVFQGGSDALLRKLGIIAMSRSNDPSSCCLIGASDLETIHGRSLVALANKQPGGMWGGNSRYLFKVDDLIKKVTSSNAFRWTISAQAPCAYLSMDVVDLTNNGDLKCVAIAGHSQGPTASISSIRSDALKEMVHIIQVQDSQLSFKRIALEHCVAPGSVPAALNDLPPDKIEGSCRILVFVRNTPSSRLSFKFCRSLAGRIGDSISLVHIVRADATHEHMKEGEEMLKSFSDISIDHMIRRRVVRQEDGRTLLDTLLEEIRSLSPDLIILSTETLAGTHSISNGPARPASWTFNGDAGSSRVHKSSSLALIRAALPIPILVVKPDSMGTLTHENHTHKDPIGTPEIILPGSIKAVIEVSSSTLPMLHWLEARLLSNRDRLIIVKPLGLDSHGLKSNLTERIIYAHEREAKSKGFKVSSQAIAKSHSGLVEVVEQARPDILCIQAPDSRETPSHITEVLMNAKTSILVWRPLKKIGRF